MIQAKAIMREPDAVVYEWQGPRAALRTMDTHDRDAMFLIARNFTLRGILTEERANVLAAERKQTLEGAEVAPALTTTPETYIDDIVPIAAKSRHPDCRSCREWKPAGRDSQRSPALRDVQRANRRPRTLE